MNNRATYKNQDTEYEHRKEIRDYLERFKDSSPEEIIRYMGKMRDFFYNNMTEEGRKIFEQFKKSKLEGSI